MAGAHEYLFSRSKLQPPDAEPYVLEGAMFFQLWATRQRPFEELREGDTMWWADSRRRVVRWELKVNNLLRTRFDDVPHALRLLRQKYGVMPDVDPVVVDGSGRFGL